MDASVANVVTPPEHVEPVFASQLISDEKLDDLVDRVCHSRTSRRKCEKSRLKTNVRSVDDALGGGLESATVVCVSGEAAAGTSEICRTYLVSSLLQHANSTAAVIDTTGNFDIFRVYTLIVARLSAHVDGIPESLRSLLDPEKGVGIEEVAAMVLDRVNIMRVFDFEGVKEAVGEIEAALEKVEDEVERKNVVGLVGEEEEKRMNEREDMPNEPEKPKRTYVADSEDEEDGEEDEMLFNIETIETTTTTVAAPPVQIATLNISPSKPLEQQPSTIKFILIETLAQVINPLLKKDYIQANALSSAFLASLASITHKHNLHTLLINPIIPPRLPSPTRPPAANAPPPRQRQEPPPIPSI
ncbi:hypothetical protein Ptr902_06608 [Pyrenophora tritici-repentis]|nr:hypothetical protein Ptr902_06608 [Pyrenophora tritici-repentis]